MDKNIKATTLGSLHQDLFFNKKVSISFDTLEYDNTAEYKVLVQIEPPSIREDIINNLLNYNNNFDLILTWHPQVLSKCKNSILFPFGSCWINKEDRKIHSKIKPIIYKFSGNYQFFSKLYNPINDFFFICPLNQHYNL